MEKPTVDTAADFSAVATSIIREVEQAFLESPQKGVDRVLPRP